MSPTTASDSENELLSSRGFERIERDETQPLVEGTTMGRKELSQNTESRPQSNQAFDYELFLRRMRHPACRLIVTRAKEFIQSLKRQCEQGISIGQVAHQYRDFLDTTMSMIRENPVWRLMGDVRPTEYELASEGLEYLLMNQLHGIAFSPVDDRDRDAQIERKIILYADWVQPHHLDLLGGVKEDCELMVRGIAEFRKVNEYITPRDKLICFLNGCRYLQSLVEGKNPDASADEMLPVIIFALLKSRIAQLHSNLQYISRFRDGRVLAGEKSGYVFTGLLAASTFIENMDQKSLVVEDEEYSEWMEEGIMKVNARTLDEQESTESAQAFDSQPSPTAFAGAPPPLSPDTRLREEATKLYQNVKERLRLGASKSFDYLGKLVDEAEAQIKAAIKSGDGTPRAGPGSATERALQDEDEFQLQLAMALSLSEQEHQHQQSAQQDIKPEQGQWLISEPDKGRNPTSPLLEIADELADLDFSSHATKTQDNSIE